MAKNSSSKKIGESQIWAFLAVLLSIVGFILVFLTRKDDKYAMYYAKQSLVLFISGLIVMAVGIVPILGWFISAIAGLVMFILWVITIVYSLSGETKETPLIGKFAERFDF